MEQLPSLTPPADPAAETHRREFERLQAVMDQSPVAMALFVGDELAVSVLNQHMADIWNTDIARARHQPLLQTLPELEGQGFDDLIRGVRETGVAYEGRETLARLRRGGEVVDTYYNFVYSAYRDEAGEVIGVLDVATEVTELVLARQHSERVGAALAAANQNLEHEVAARTAELDRAFRRIEAQHAELARTFEQVPITICIFKGEDLVCDLANPPYCAIVDRPAAELLGRPLLEAIPELADQGFDELLRSVIRSGESLTFENVPVRLRRGGAISTGYYTFTYEPYRDAHGVVTGVTVVGFEVTARHLATERLAAAERESRTILESMPHMSWTHLPDGTRSFISQRWADYSGLPLDDVATYDWLSIVHPDDREPAQRLYRECLASGRAFTHEQRLRRHDGQWRWHLNRAVPLRDDGDGSDGGGAIRLWVGTATDIHELREAETRLLELSEEVQDTNEVLNSRNRELARANRALTRSNADMDSFVYTASHDLKAPITNIQGLQALLREELAGRGTGVEPILDMIDGSLERFMRTLRDLGDIARLKAAEDSVAEETSLADVLADVLLDCAQGLEESSATVVSEVGEACRPRVSHKNLRSVVYNLVSNAIKYRSPERPLEVHIACVAEGGFDVLSVRDNGLGMDLSGDHKLFTMFYRMHDHVEGSGVGLHIVQKIVDNLGGRLEVESAPDVGTTFRAYFKSTP